MPREAGAEETDLGLDGLDWGVEYTPGSYDEAPVEVYEGR